MLIDAHYLTKSDIFTLEYTTSICLLRMNNWRLKSIAFGVGIQCLLAGAAYSQPLNELEIKSLLEQAQQFESLGEPQKVIELSQQAIATLHSTQTEIEALAWGQLGNGYLLAGEWEKAIAAYQHSFSIAQARGYTHLQNTAANGLVTAYKREEEFYQRQAELITDNEQRQEAAQLAQQAHVNTLNYSEHALVSTSPEVEWVGGFTKTVQAQAPTETKTITEVQAQLQAIELGTLDRSYIEEIADAIETLPSSTRKIFLLLDASRFYPDRETILETAIAEAQALPERRTEAIAWLFLGQHYEEAQQPMLALEAAQKSQWLAQQVFADSPFYEALWLEARLNQKLGFEARSRQNYREAVAALGRIRDNLLSANQEVQLDFKEEVEPVYRQYLSLLLQKGDRSSLEKALRVVDALKLAQLENFFGSPCAEVDEEIDPQAILAESNAALITTVILPEQTYIILQTPDGGLKHHAIDVSADEVEQTVESWHSEILNLSSDAPPLNGQKLYSLLIEPIEAELEGVDTLIFNNDGILRNAPMAALHNGNQYLVEKYPVTSNLGLKLEQTETATSSADPLIFGLSVPTKNFAKSLPNVEHEVEEIHELLGGKQVLNQNFSAAKLTALLKDNDDHSVIHFATHGEFGGTLNTSYLEAYDQPIKLGNLETILRGSEIPLSLLVFSACETATGNERAVLGMAGLGLRTGADSTLGSLWRFNDAPAADLVTDFYRYWHQGMTKAQALQQAQLDLIEETDSHVSVWASMVLLGDWH